jgi:hypothetical protein
MDVDQFEIASSRNSRDQKSTLTIQTHALLQDSPAQNSHIQLSGEVHGSPVGIFKRFHPTMSIFIDDRIHARPSATMDIRLLLLATFLRRIAFFLDMVWMHSTLARGILVSRDFIDLTLDGNRTMHNNKNNDEHKQSKMTSNDRIYSGPSATMEDDEFFLLLWVQLSLARDIATSVITNLLAMSQIQQSTVLLSPDSWNPRARRVTRKQKLRTPPDKTKTNNNQKSSIFWITLPTSFHVFRMNPANGTFNSEGDAQSTIWTMKQRKQIDTTIIKRLYLKSACRFFSTTTTKGHAANQATIFKEASSFQVSPSR